ncbi:hypothetical protein Nmel_017405 [Mimus melanotis]
MHCPKKHRPFVSLQRAASRQSHIQLCSFLFG